MKHGFLSDSPPFGGCSVFKDLRSNPTTPSAPNLLHTASPIAINPVEQTTAAYLRLQHLEFDLDLDLDLSLDLEQHTQKLALQRLP